MKKGIDYFETFSDMARATVKAAESLNEMVSNYTNVAQKAEKIHEIEHEADMLFHEMAVELNRAFITPIDREDILALADKIDSIIDAIEDVANLFDMLSVTSVHPEAILMTDTILRSAQSVLDLVCEFKSFKHSKKLNDLVIAVNGLEEAGDRQHRSVIKKLYLSGADVLEIMKWKEIYDTMERVLDMCEDVADLISGLAIKNE